MRRAEILVGSIAIAAAAIVGSYRPVIAPEASAPAPSPIRQTSSPAPVAASLQPPTPEPTVTPRPTPRPTVRIATARQEISGVASWYDWRPDEAAAGGPLRELLGQNWRGTTVRVVYQGRSVTVVLTDWCGCPDGRIIDLDRRSFAELEQPVLGLIDVVVESDR